MQHSLRSDTQKLFHSRKVFKVFFLIFMVDGYCLEGNIYSNSALLLKQNFIALLKFTPLAMNDIIGP